MANDLVEVARRTAVGGGVVLLLIVLVVGIGYTFDVLLLAFAGVLLAILLRTITDFVNRHARAGDKASLVVAVLLVVGTAVGIAWYLLPQVAEQSEELRQTLPKSIDRLTAELKNYEPGRWVLEHIPEPSDLRLQRFDVLGRVTGVFSAAFSAVGMVVVVFFIGLYLAAQHRLYLDGITRLVPLHRRDRAADILGQIGVVLRRWLMGKLAAMVFVGLLVWLTILLLGLPFALSLAVFAALLTFIPNFGPIISAVPAVLVGMLDSPMTAVWVIVAFIAIQTVESYILTPLIEQSTVALPPALTITAQLMLGVLVGGIGLALATPLTLVVLVLVRTVYIRDMLGDDGQPAEPLPGPPG